MSLAPFDYDKAIETPSDRWKTLGLHWHCYTWRGTGADWANDSARSSDATDITPSRVRAWLNKGPRLIRATPKTPEDAVAWLRDLWEPVVAQELTPQPEIDWDFRYRFAVYDLSVGNDLSWAEWVKGPSVVSAGIVATTEGCH